MPKIKYFADGEADPRTVPIKWRQSCGNINCACPPGSMAPTWDHYKRPATARGRTVVCSYCGMRQAFMNPWVQNGWFVDEAAASWNQAMLDLERENWDGCRKNIAKMIAILIED